MGKLTLHQYIRVGGDVGMADRHVLGGRVPRTVEEIFPILGPDSEKRRFLGDSTR